MRVSVLRISQGKVSGGFATLTGQSTNLSNAVRQAGAQGAKGFQNLFASASKSASSVRRVEGEAKNLASQVNRIPSDKMINVHTKGLANASAGFRQIDRSFLRMVRSGRSFFTRLGPE